MENSAELDLKVAISFMQEITEELEPYKKSLEWSADAWEGGIWQGFKASYSVGREERAIQDKLEHVLSLASNARSLDPEISIIQNIDGEAAEFTADSIISAVYGYKGILSIMSGRWKEAQQWFQKSIAVYPTADATLRLSYTYAAQGFREEAIASFRKVIQMEPSSEEAVEARKSIIELERIKPKKWSTALILSVLLGLFGIDRIYLGYYMLGIVKLFTFGGFYIWWFIDIVRIATDTLRDADGMRLEKASDYPSIQEDKRSANSKVSDDIKCPICGCITAIRTSKRGQHIGQEFHVCTNYPECKGKIAVK